MSTITILDRREKAKPPGLVRFLPRFVGGERELRRISMLPEIHAWLFRPAGNDPLRQVKAAAIAHFAQFVRENEIDDCEYMHQIADTRKSDPFAHGVWSMRPRFRPEHRFFGMFAVPDWFLMFDKRPHAYLDQHPTRWLQEIDKCVRIWGALFPGIPAFTCRDFGGYVTHNASHCDGRWYPI